jgi:hypothetical protein
MVGLFINPSTIQFFLKINKNPTAAAHGGREYIPQWATALPQRHADVRR